MNRTIFTGFLALAMGAALMAQAPAPPKAPQPKSQKEVQALQAMFGAQDADTRIKAAEDLMTNFADTEFKSIALFFEAMSYQQKGDADKAIVYAERTLEADPKQYQAMLMLAELTAQRTREHDLDREEKLNRATKYANDAIAVLKDAAKPNPQLTDEQWEAAKKSMFAQAHQALGFAAMARKKNDDAINEFKSAVESEPNEPAFQVRLAQAEVAGGKYDDAIALCEKVMAIPDAHPQVKQVAQATRAMAMQQKSGNKPAATTPAAPPQIEVKKP